MPCFTVQPNKFVKQKSFFAANTENEESRFPNISFTGFCKKHFLKVNEPRYKRCGVTPHFPKTKKIAAENFAEAGSAITNDNDSRS